MEFRNYEIVVVVELLMFLATAAGGTESHKHKALPTNYCKHTLICYILYVSYPSPGDGRSLHQIYIVRRVLSHCCFALTFLSYYTTVPSFDIVLLSCPSSTFTSKSWNRMPFCDDSPHLFRFIPSKHIFGTFFLST